MARKENEDQLLVDVDKDLKIEFKTWCTKNNLKMRKQVGILLNDFKNKQIKEGKW